MAAPAEVTYVSPHPESATTLRTIVELVRRIMKADVASILGFSFIDQSVTWKAASGFTSAVDFGESVFRPLGSTLARRALEENKIAIIQGIGTRPEFPVEDFPVHVAEGVCDIAVAPMPIVGNNSGAIVAGYRSPHKFTEDEKHLLRNLAEMAAVVLDSARLVETVVAAEKIWEQTFHAIGEGILVYDRSKRIVRCNPRAAEMVEMQPEDVIGLSFDEVFARMFGKQAVAYYLAERGDSSSVFEVRTEGGRRTMVSIFPIEAATRDSVNVVTLNDVTRLSEIQEQLARSRRLGSVGQLAAGVAHEINNPLAAIATCAEAIMRDVQGKKDLQVLASEHQWSYYLDEILRQALRCKEITRGLLDLTRQREPKRTLCDINAIARQCAKVAAQQGDSARIEFEVALDDSLGQTATDASMVRQIIDNLLTNALDALGETGGKIEISTLRDGDRIMIQVADTGHGISPDVLPRVFDPFFSTKGPGKGYGLGLAISAAIAESLKGALSVESKEGAGSKFRLWLPRRPPEK